MKAKHSGYGSRHLFYSLLTSTFFFASFVSAQVPSDVSKHVSDTLSRLKDTLPKTASSESTAKETPAPAQVTAPAASQAVEVTSPQPRPAPVSEAKAPRVVVYKAKPPTDSKYWEFLNWYKQHAVVSLLVASSDRESLINSLVKLQVLMENGVLVGPVYVLGYQGALMEIQVGGTVQMPKVKDAKNFSSEDFKKTMSEVKVNPTELSVLAKNNGLQDGQLTDARPIVDKFNLKSSPTWIVRYQGRNYIYEGEDNILKFFSKEGAFLGAKQ